MPLKIIYPQLPKGFKTKWVRALRSGEYKQGRGYLKAEESTRDEHEILIQEYVYCCLGVAGELCGVKKMEQNGNGLLQKKAGMRGLTKVPKPLINNSPAGKIINGKYKHLEDALISMNDNGYSFKYIATWIEKHL